MAILALEDGTVWQGKGFGACTERVGEVVFNTALSGYQEVLTDPSYAGQMVVMTATQIGNTGINHEDGEWGQPAVEGFIVRETSAIASNWRSTTTLDEFLRTNGVPGIAGLNTRALTLHLRTYGALRGALSTVPDAQPAQLIAKARAWPGLAGRDLVLGVTCAEPYVWSERSDAQWELPHASGARRPRIVVYDFGAKRNIMRRLASLGSDVVVMPASAPPEQALQARPDGVLLSNGPGDPEGLTYAIATTRRLVESGVPTLGICLGHQLLGLALGGRTYKLKFGHHGSNQPVKASASGRVRITSQNHNYAISPEGLPSSAIITEWNLNDQTVEGFRLAGQPVWAVQYHPEASPGPHDADDVLAQFVQDVRETAA